MRLCFVQWSGDFREAAARLAAGGAETYRAQRYTVDYVEKLAGRFEVSVITLTADAFDEILPSGVRAIGLNSDRPEDAVGALARIDPDLIVLRLPMRQILSWANKRGKRTLALLADSFQGTSLKDRLKRRLLVRALNHRATEWVTNHGRNATEHLRRIGVKAEKLIAWDYPQIDTPDRYEPKQAAGRPARVLYVGSLIESKGVTDLADAVRRLPGVSLDLIGKGSLKPDGANVIGPVTNDRIIPAMREADIVVVPSRHDYPEGMPLTIYEAYCSRTPLIASDHPMFEGNVVHEESGLTFRGGDVDDLARQIKQLIEEPDLYARLSANSKAAWERLQIPVMWDELIDRWLDRDTKWLRGHSLAGAA